MYFDGEVWKTVPNYHQNSLLSGVLAMFYVFDNILILFKSMASCDALPTSICYECRDLDYVVKHDYTTIFSELTL